MSRHHHYDVAQQPDIATLARILRTTRGMKPEEKAEIRQKLRDAQSAQHVPNIADRGPRNAWPPHPPLNNGNT